MPISASLMSYKDRTSEFQFVIGRLKRIQSPESNDASQNDVRALRPLASATSDFNKRASRISLGLHEVSQKIARLAKLTKKTSIFDDPAKDIEELIAVVKQDITALNAALSELQEIQNSQIGDGVFSKDGAIHFSTVIDDLNNRFKGTTKEFKDALVMRSENLKAHENRKQLFSSTTSKVNTFGQPRASGMGSSINAKLPPWTNGSAPSSSLMTSRGLSVDYGSQLRRRAGIDNPVSISVQEQVQQQLMQQENNYVQSRATALQNVESTISELGNMFTQLATMVAHQGELAIRIDDNIDESLSNVERAQDSLLKHLRQISSNRWLMIKIFMVLIIFLLVFIVFIA